MRLSSRLAVLLAGFAVAASSLPAFATQAVSVDLGRVDVDDPLRAGERYRLPTLGVSNPGTSVATYEVYVGEMEGKLAAPGAWFRLDPVEFRLGPGETQPVEVQLVLPPDADPARYEQLISARIMLTESEGAAVGAAAASILTFEVVPSSLVEGMWLSAVSFFRAGHPWTTGGAGVVLLLLLLWWAIRNFEFDVRRKT